MELNVHVTAGVHAMNWRLGKNPLKGGGELEFFFSISSPPHFPYPYARFIFDSAALVNCQCEDRSTNRNAAWWIRARMCECEYQLVNR